jgi:1-acyl-sn-glycerol-3-phosphate acyltransferase
MGKKDKEKQKKKGKHGETDAPFSVPRPPPWPLPAWLTRARLVPAPAVETAPTPAPASSETAVAPGASGMDAGGTPVAGQGTPVAGHGAPVAGQGTVATQKGTKTASDHSGAIQEGTKTAGDGSDSTAQDRTPLSGAPVSADSVPPPASGEVDIETLDFADIADIAPVAPAELGDEPAPSGPGSAAPRPAEPTVEELTQQIRELEARLDRMLDERRSSSSTPPAPRSSASAAAAARGADLDWKNEAAPAAPASSAHDLLSSEFYLRQWGRSGMRQRAEEVDEFGFDPAYEEKLRPFVDFLYRYYFRVDTQGVAQIPAEGRCVIVANHAGGPLPYDGLMLRAAVRREHDHRRDLRWLAEDLVFYLPFVGASLNRLGAVRACQENAERLLSRERLVAVFPEGAKGIGKLFGDRYRLQRFGRGGFIRLCLRTDTPIVPCAIVGAEEANPTVYRVESLAKLVGLPYLPVTPTFPALGPVGLLPAPTKWKIRFGEPIRFTSYGPEAADDDLLVTRLAEGVRAVIQEMLNGMLTTRRSIWFG